MPAATAVATAVFCVCLFLVAYTYFLYPATLLGCYLALQARRDWQYLTGRHNRRIRPLSDDCLPAVTLIIPAHNEQAALPAKIANLREMEYPSDRLEVIFVSDGSTDGTNEILRGVEGFRVLVTDRAGKAAALNEGVRNARCDLLVMSDAATLFAPDALKNLARHFVDPGVGAVCGSLILRGSLESERTEGAYWKYESMIRLMEARLDATLTASGAIYALRRECYRPLPAGTVLDDFLIPMRARSLGYRVLYDPEVVATEFAASSVTGEFARRVRLAVGSFRALRELIRTPLRGFSLVAFLSHKLLRWIVPFLLLGLLSSNCFLLASLWGRLAFTGQLLFYLWAGMGFVFRERLKNVRYGLIGYFLLAMNLALLLGFVRCLTGHQEGLWQRVE